MTTKDEIRSIITQRLGLTDMVKYKAYVDELHRADSPRIASAEEMALLNPDTIDNRAFWEVSEEVFGTDPVANCQYREPLSKVDGNRQNLSLYKLYGFLGFLDICGLGDANVLEIGPGYGAFKHWCEVNTRVNYFGADVYPKVEGVDETERTGLLGAATKARRYRVVISCNVFQHLSVNQRRTYYRDVYDILEPEGIFMVSQCLDDLDPNDPRRINGPFYMKHYGQFTEIQKREAILDDLTPHFTVQAETRYGARCATFATICIKKAPKP